MNAPSINVPTQDARWFRLCTVDGVTVTTADGCGVVYRQRDRQKMFRLLFASLRRQRQLAGRFDEMRKVVPGRAAGAVQQAEVGDGVARRRKRARACVKHSKQKHRTARSPQWWPFSRRWLTARVSLTAARGLSHFGEHSLGWLVRVAARGGAGAPPPERFPARRGRHLRLPRGRGADEAFGAAQTAAPPGRRGKCRHAQPAQLPVGACHFHHGRGHPVGPRYGFKALPGLPLPVLLVPPMALSRILLGVHYPSDVAWVIGPGAAVAADSGPDARGVAQVSGDSEAAVKGPPANLFTGVIKAMRPRQWMKNVLVLAAPLAALGGPIHHNYAAVLIQVSVAFVAFSLGASSIYLVNDVRDVEADREHPTKRFRPIAAGVVPESARLHPVCCAGRGLAGHCMVADPEPRGGDGRLHRDPARLLLRPQAPSGHRHLHRVVGIPAPAIAGGVATGIPLSQWFLLTAAFGSLFIAAGKRYAELQLAERTGAKIRKSLENYTSTYLRFVWTLSATAVVICYGLLAFERDAPLGGPGTRCPSFRSPSRSCATRSTSTAAWPGNPKTSLCETGCCSCCVLAWIGTVGAAVAFG